MMVERREEVDDHIGAIYGYIYTVRAQQSQLYSMT